MRCSTVRKKLMAYVAAELPPEEHKDIRGHVERCDSCQSRLGSALRISDALALLSAEKTAPDLLGSVRERLTREQFGRRRMPSRRLAAAFAILLLGALIGTGWFWQKSGVRESVPMAQQPKSIQTPIERHQAAPPAVAAPEPIAKAETHKPIAHRPAEKHRPAGSRPPVRRPPEVHPVRDGRIVVKDREESPAPEVVPEAEMYSEPAIIFALRPRAPETYVIQVSDQGESLATELSVVREFDIGGNVTSVTIEHTVSPTPESDPETPIPGSSQLMEISPAREFYAENSNSGGYIHHA